jgi:hypothetical protein
MTARKPAAKPLRCLGIELRAVLPEPPAADSEPRSWEGQRGGVRVTLDQWHVLDPRWVCVIDVGVMRWHVADAEQLTAREAIRQAEREARAVWRALGRVCG